MENYLEKCLDSMLQDTNDYEIVCVDDGSSDRSLDILKQYERKNQKIKVIHKENGGVSSARNVGIYNATGEYIWFVDSDDALVDGCLSQIIQLLKTYSPELMEITWLPTTSDMPNCPSISTLDFFVENSNKSVYATFQALVKRKLLTEYQIRFREDIKYGEDTLFWYYVYLRSTGKNRVTVRTPVYLYRRHAGSAMAHNSAGSFDKHVADLIEMGRTYQSDYERKIVDDPDKIDNIKKRQYLAILAALTILPKSSLDYKMTMDDLKKSKLYPIPLIFWHIADTTGWKGKVKEGVKLCFSLESFYKIYFHLLRKSRELRKLQ